MSADRGSEGLMEAVCAADLPRVRSLLAEGADANVRDDAGCTPLHFAALAGPHDFREVSIHIEERGVIMEEGRSVHDRRPLAVMAEIARLLLEHGALVDAADANGWTPLILACSRGQAEVVQVLLEHKADPNHLDRSNHTPLLVAARHGYADEIRMLVERVADPAVEDQDGWSPLALVLVKGMDEAARRLTDRGAPLETSKPCACLPLHQVVMYGLKNLTEFLLDRGADVNSRGEGFRTALHWAAHEGHLAELDMEIFYPHLIYSDGRHMKYETIRLGNSSRVQEMAKAELSRR